jgi:hypothetical protein
MKKGECGETRNTHEKRDKCTWSLLFFFQKTWKEETTQLLIYKIIIIPIWTYGLELWGCASKSNISIIERRQSKILRMIVDAPLYVSYATLHADLGISYVQDVIHQKCNNHHTRLETHENPLLKKLLLREENRRLKRNWPIDLMWGTGNSPLDDSPSRHCNNHKISL